MNATKQASVTSWLPDISKQGNATRNMCLSSFEILSSSVFFSLLEVLFQVYNTKKFSYIKND